jgi:dolichyl-phosphate beta-glucosyltransferase
MSSPVDLSIVVPAYQEASRISEGLRQVDEYLIARGGRSEILVVDDGSADATVEVVREVAGSLSTPTYLLVSEENRGKGHALKLGFAAARGERILFTDADLSTPISCADEVLAPLDAAFDFVLGSRKMTGARLEVRQPWLRETLGKGFTWLARVLIADVSDLTCGFKAFRGDVGRDLFARVRIDDWSFDAELLLIARHQGVRFMEVPVAWNDREGTKVRLLRDIVNTLVGLARMRAYLFFGRYETHQAAGAATCERLAGRTEGPGEAGG